MQALGISGRIAAFFQSARITPLLALVALGGLIASAVALSRNERWRIARDRAFMRVPLLSGLIENGETATLARTLGTMVRNGVPLLPKLAPGAPPVKGQRLITVPQQARPGWRRDGLAIKVSALAELMRSLDKSAGTFEHAYDY